MLRRVTGREPALFLAIALAVFLGTAILKPWEGNLDRTAPAPSGRSSESTAAATRSTPEPFVPRPSLSPEQLAAAVGAHGLWGIAAIGTRPTTVDPTEVWVAMEDPPTGKGGRSEPTVFLPTARYAVRALVITSPPGQILLLGRSWRLAPGADPEPLAVQPFRGQMQTSPSVVIPPPDGLFGIDRWLPGTYRFEVILANRTAAITVLVIGRAGGRRV